MKTYLGDSVYVDFDGHDVILTTENGDPNDPSNTIIMEPVVVEAFIRFLEERIKQNVIPE